MDSSQNQNQTNNTNNTNNTSDIINVSNKKSQILFVMQGFFMY